MKCYLGGSLGGNLGGYLYLSSRHRPAFETISAGLLIVVVLVFVAALVIAIALLLGGR